MNQQFEVKLLLKQNSQMVSKIQVYRRQNQMLIQKNYDLNLWVQNLSEVFAAIGAAWKVITNNQQALFNLIKKKGDPNSMALISKYVSHFKTFDEIISRLGEKITNSGHSNEVTLDVKTRLSAFVQNYELFFKEIADTYFKFNDECIQWLTQIKNNPESAPKFRILSGKELQNRQKIKEFENFIAQFRGRFKIYESQNQHKLLDGILFRKNQQINSLIQQNQKQARRLHLITNYITNNVQAILDADQKDFECFCGGIQLQYFKREWEKHLEEIRNQNNKQKFPKSDEFEKIKLVNKEEIELMEFEKQKLLDRISSLQCKIEKMKIQSRLTQDLVLNSSAYMVLHSQGQQLMIFIDDLLNKINHHYSNLYEIQKAREEEILELKNKLLKTDQSTASNKQIIESPKIKVQTNIVQFKSNLTSWIKELISAYNQMNSKIVTKQQTLLKSKQFSAALQKQVQQLNKKICQLEEKANFLPFLEFRHQKFNQVEKKITDLLNSLTEKDYPDQNHLLTLWKEFLGYIKSRDKKIKDLESSLKKKDKDLQLKDKLVNTLQEGLKQTQEVYLSTQNQVKKFSQFIVNTEKELCSLAEKNLSLKSELEQQKLLMNYKLKTEGQSKARLEEKIKSYEVLDEQAKELKRVTQQTQASYEIWINEQEKKLMNVCLQLQQAKTQYEMKKAESEEKDRTIKKLIEEKQKWKSEWNKLGAKFNAIEEKSEIGVIKMQMEEYKRKLMCNCSRDQERSVVLKTCPHAFCKKCIEDMNNSRNRKCPLCGIKFGKSDLHDIILS